MNESSHDTLLRQAAFDRVRALSEIHDHLTAQQLGEGFFAEGQRYPLVNPRRGNFKPAQMRFLLSINTVFPKTGNQVWYDDQREVHGQIFDGDQMVDYAFMGDNPDAADNRWLREAFENQIPIIYFLGIAPGRYQAFLPAFVGGFGIDRRSAAGSVSVFLDKTVLRRLRRTSNADMRCEPSSNVCIRRPFGKLSSGTQGALRLCWLTGGHAARRCSHRRRSARLARSPPW